ncbi:MAG: InlB B-repeat-containing protein [Oscillospiraceae bacterium]|nr:InlB B-repeat-containing protein [Oscillospiraceae bacterium]
MKRRILSSLLALCIVASLLAGLVCPVVSAVAETRGMTGSQLESQIRSVYKDALARARKVNSDIGRKIDANNSFSGYCATYVKWQIKLLGIDPSPASGHGKDMFDNYKNKSQSSGGKYIAAYSAASYGNLKTILNLITDNGTKNVYNILIGFQQYTGNKDGRTYGHTTFIHGIVNGMVYSSESFSGKFGTSSTISEGDPIVLSISNYFSAYPASKYYLDGVIVFSDQPNYTLYCHNNYSGKNYLYGTDFSGSLNSDIIYSRDTSVTTVSTDQTTQHNGNSSLKIVNTSAGSSGKDLAIATLTNDRAANGWIGDSKQMTLSFWAKASNPNTGIYFRWGYGSYNGVTLSQDWAYYSIPMNRTTTYGKDMHPYVDRAGTVWITEMQLEDGTEATAFAPESVRINYEKTVQTSGQNYQLPSVAPSREGYSFAGWYTAKNGGTQITSQTTVQDGNLIVYARWIPDACQHEYALDYETPATCEENGERHFVCSLCGENYSVLIAALGHQYQSSLQPATCVDYGVTTYTCTVCGYSYSETEDDEYSEWSISYPAGANNNAVESATGYRYRLLETTTGSGSQMEGWTGAGSEWIQTDGGSVQYVASWPAGFNTNNAYYSQYHNTPVTESETETQKTSVDSDNVIGYLYWHWCRNSYTSGPIDRLVADQCEGEFTGFHCFFSTTSPSSLTMDSSGTVYKYANANCCTDTWWYFALPVRQQDYQMLEKLYHFERWSEWSDWDTEVIEETATCDVETATIYRYATSLLEGHQWGEWTVVTEPTCTVDGQRSRTCTVCGETETEAIPAAHNWDENEQFCTVCGALNPDYIALCVAPASGTVQPGESVTVPVSITDNTGFAGFTFIITCDEGLTITNITKGALLSTSESGSFTKNIESGKVTWYDVENLTNDGVLFNLVLTLSANAEPGEYGITIALKDSQPTNFVDYLSQAVPIRFTAGKVVYNDHTHSYTAVTTSPTCTEAGAIIYTCECGDTYSETLEPLGHLQGEATEEVTTPATCTTAGSGYAVVYCERCNIELSREAIVLPALGHDYVETVLIPVTCTEDGASQFTCSRCGDSYTQIIPALGHIFEDEVLIPATCTEEGAILRTCSRCNYQTTEFVAPLGHNYAEEVLIAATCTDDGASQFTCSRCGDTKTEVTPALGHLLERTVTEPTCEEDGSIVETCSRCGYTHTEALPALGHDYVGTILLEPTCTTRGVIRYSCSRCSSQYSEFIPAGHDLSYTDNGNGTHTASCSRCDYSVTEEHSYINGTCVCGASELVPEIKSASLLLNEDIDIIYSVQIPEGFTDPYLVVNGARITDSFVQNDRLCFVYTGITPQCMGDSITAVLHASRNGKEVTDTVANYSVKQYCINQLANHPEDTVLKTLLADLLCYGAAAQQYTNYRTDSLVTTGLDLTPSAFGGISNKTASFTGTADMTVDWIGAGLILGNSVSMRLTFTAENIQNLSVTVAINGREEAFNSEDFNSAGDGKYYIDFCGIEANEFDDAVTASFSCGGKSVGRVLSYTVNAYVCSTQNSDNASLQTLVKALYNYGVSALAYAESQ